MIKETLIYQGDSKWSRNAYIKFVGDKIVFDCSDGEYGPIEFDIQAFYEAELKHAHDVADDWDATLMDGLENEPYVSGDFQIGPDGAYEHIEEDACNWTLVREKDGLTKQSKDIKWIEWDAMGLFEADHEVIGIGRSLIMSPFNECFTWQTTQITEILEEKEHYIKFKTLNSTYELFKLV